MHNNRYLLHAQEINHLVSAETSPIPVPSAYVSTRLNDIADLSTAELPVVQAMQQYDSYMVAALATDHLPITSPFPQITLPSQSSESEVVCSEKTNAVLAQKRLAAVSSPVVPRLTLPQKLPAQVNLSESEVALVFSAHTVTSDFNRNTVETPLVSSLMRFAL